MDFWTFVSKVIDALAWPGLLLFLILKFRDRFGSLFDRLTEATFPGGFAGKFSPALERAKEVADEILPPQSDVAAQIEHTNPIATDERALEANPSGVIMEMWQAVIAQAKELVETLGGRETVSSSRFVNPAKIRGTLDGLHLATPEELQLFDELRLIRNDVAHSKVRATPADAGRYRSLAEKLILQWVVRIANGRPAE